MQYFFSTKPNGPLAEALPEGFEAYENIRGQVFCRRIQAKLISDAERDCIERGIEGSRRRHSYKTEVRGKILTIFERTNPWRESSGNPWQRFIDERFMNYQAVVRFVLEDQERRLFRPERYCFRGSVDDWIEMGPPDTIEKVASVYLKHLGEDSMFEKYYHV